jgi:hypothetical protein
MNSCTHTHFLSIGFGGQRCKQIRFIALAPRSPTNSAAVGPVGRPPQLLDEIGRRLSRAQLEYPLRRKLSVRAIGENTTRGVQRYLANQVPSARFVDSHFAAWLERFSFEDPDVDLNERFVNASS